jgi:hypothetical protein
VHALRCADPRPVVELGHRPPLRRRPHVVGSSTPRRSVPERRPRTLRHVIPFASSEGGPPERGRAERSTHDRVRADPSGCCFAVCRCRSGPRRIGDGRTTPDQGETVDEHPRIEDSDRRVEMKRWIVACALSGCVLIGVATTAGASEPVVQACVGTTFSGAAQTLRTSGLPGRDRGHCFRLGAAAGRSSGSR